MLSKVVVVPVDEFKKWYFGSEVAPAPKLQKAAISAGATVESALDIFNRKFCTACHSLDGSPMVGPSFKGLYGKKRMATDLKGVEHGVTADDAYLARAIQDPAAENVKGYPPAMPKNPLTETELKQVIHYIQSLK
jgi:cytochrome c oxidase subunit 2